MMVARELNYCDGSMLLGRDIVTVPRRTRLAVDQSILLHFLFLHRRGPLCPLLHGFPLARGLALPTTISRRAFMFHHAWL